MVTQVGEREIRVGRYYNANYQAMIIVAVLNPRDWAVYANGVGYMMPKMEAAQWCAKHGCKMLEKDARYFFPDIKLPYRH